MVSVVAASAFAGTGATLFFETLRDSAKHNAELLLASGLVLGISILWLVISVLALKSRI
jgi:hypothetical protein